jgi:hypothetical protein
MLAHDAHELGLTLEEIRKWEPPSNGRRMKAEGETESEAKGETRKEDRSEDGLSLGWV